jgi:hypothetical protein
VTDVFALYLCVSILACGLPLVAIELRRPHPNLLEPIVLANLGFFGSYFFKGLLIQFDRDLFVTYPLQWANPGSLLPYFAISWLALLCLNIGYYANCGSLGVSSPQKSIDGNARYLYLGLVLISVVSTLDIVLRINFYFPSLLYSAAAWEQFRFDVTRTWLDGGVAFLFPIYIGFFHISYEISARQSAPVWERTLIALAAIFVQIVIGSRALLLTWVLALLIFRSIWISPIAPRRQAIILSLFPLIGGAMGILQKITTEGAKSLQLEFPLNIFYRLSSSYEQFETMIDIINSKFPFDHGYSIFEDVFLTYLPRNIFAFKPIDLGFLRAQNVVFGDFWAIDRGTTYPVGILGELYFNFGYLGIFLGMLFFGAILGWLRRIAVRDPNYIATFCMIGATLLAPQRFYGQVLLVIILYLGAVTMNKLLMSFVGRSGLRPVPRTPS